MEELKSEQMNVSYINFIMGCIPAVPKNMVLKATFDLLVKSKSNNFSLKQHWQNEVSEFR